jgi:Leucine-rich repeat (LRR) protein
MSVSKSEREISFDSFSEWCLHKEILPQETRNTIELMFEIAGTYNCEEASQHLDRLTKLDFMRYRHNDDRVYDLRPIASLTQLTQLRLHGKIVGLERISALTNLQELGLHGKISNLRFLENLTKLTHIYLFLSDNCLTDLSPLSKLTNLTFLCIELGEVENLIPLKSLTNLTELKLNYCKIKDLSELKNLTKLTRLTLEGNHISELSPLSSLNSLEKLNLNQNKIADLSSLNQLNNLKILKVCDNQIQEIDRLKILANLSFIDLNNNQIVETKAFERYQELTVKLSENEIVNISLDNWLKMHFDRSEDLLEFIETDDKWSIEIPAKLRVSYVTLLFENALELLKPFSDLQVYKGLSDMHLFNRYDLDNGVVWSQMQRAIDSIFNLFEQCFNERCAPILSYLDRANVNPLNHLCYMWWDAYFCCEPPENEIDAQSNEAFLKVMEKILYLDSDACRESALHGLGHAAEYGYSDRVAIIIDRFLAENPQIKPELKNYAIDARVGYVL